MDTFTGKMQPSRGNHGILQYVEILETVWIGEKTASHHSHFRTVDSERESIQDERAAPII